METKLNPYSEVCNTIRHYSTLSYNVRVLTIVQGFIFISGWMYAYEKNYDFLIWIPVFGILFAVLIYYFHNAFYTTTEFFIEQAMKIENEIFIENHRPFNSFENYHKEKYKTVRAKIGVVNAPFFLISIIFIFLFILSIIK